MALLALAVGEPAERERRLEQALNMYGRASELKFTVTVDQAAGILEWARKRMERNVLPVPAGPTPRVKSCASICLRY